MRRIICEINGWRKELMVTEDIFFSRVIKLGFIPPLSFLASEHAEVPQNLVGDEIHFHYKGKYLNGLPLFTAD